MKKGEEEEEENMCIFTKNMVLILAYCTASLAEDPGFESRLSRDFSGVESYQ